MKKAMLYELKRILLPLCIFTAIAAALFVIIALNSTFVPENSYNTFGDPVGPQPMSPLTEVPAAILGVLCLIVPPMQFLYRMGRRSADLWYSLPIRRDALVLVRVLGGLVLIFVPYTVSYWVGFTVIAASENLFELGQYGILFAASLPVGIGLFGINTFLFTRANTLFDGIVFMLVWIFLLILPFLWLESLGIDSLYRLGGAINWTAPINFLSYSPLICLFVDFSLRICGTGGGWADAPFIYALGAAFAIAAYFGLFWTARRQKAEDIGQVSDSWFGYRMLIPACMLCTVLFFLANMDMASSVDLLMSYTVTLVAGAIAYFVYRRSFRIKLADLICLIGALVLGTALGIFGHEILAPWFDVLREQLREGALLAQTLALL